MKKNINLSGLDELEGLVAFKTKGFKTKNLKKNRTVKVRTLKSFLQQTVAVAVLLITCQLSFGQEYKIAPSSSITVKGTSSMHDWESVSNSINGNVEVSQGNGNSTNINSLNFTLPVKSIKSGKSRMDRLTYEAFKEPSNPNITFRLQSVEILSNGQAIATGTLTMAGKSRVEKVTGRLTQSAGKLIITGNHSIDMTNFDMVPPTAMMGAVKVGKDVTIEFNIILNK